MPRPEANEIQVRANHRGWVQYGGPGPLNAVQFAGPDGQYMEVGDVKNPVRGGVDPIWVHSPRALGKYRRVGSTISPPDPPSTTISFYRRHNALARMAGELTCPVNFYETTGTCKRPDDFINGWSDGVAIYSYGEANDRTHTGRTAFSDNDPTMDEVEFILSSHYNVGTLGFGEQASVQVEREVVDLVYASSVQCADCGTTDDGTKRIFAVTKSSGAGSPGTPSEVVYTTDGGANWSNVNITGLGGTVDPTGIEVVGNYVVALDTAGNGYWYAELNALTGVPGTWTQVTAGFVTSKQPNDIYVVSPQEVYFAGNGGYVYKSTDIPSGVTVLSAGVATTNNLIRIHGLDDTIVACGESGTIIKTVNRGASFSTTTTSPTSATFRALVVLDAYRYWLGTSGGKVYYTINGGETFTEQVLAGALTVIDDIVAATDEVIHIAARIAGTTGRLVTTYNGGASWASSASSTTPRIQNLPTATRYNRIAVPREVDPQIMANFIALGGLSGGGTDGIIVLGAAARA